MISRRQILFGASAATVAALAKRATPVIAKASQPATPISFSVPAGACDCHVHIFDPRRFYFAPTRGYTPEEASVGELLALQRALHMDRVVIIQASPYGLDSSCTVDAVLQLGSRARGVAAFDESVPKPVLDEMHHIGIRGVRLTLIGGSQDPAAARRTVQAAVDHVAPRKWHVQMYTQLAVIAAIKDVVAASSAPVVFDHFGGAQAALGVQQPGFDVLVDLLRSGHAYVKISAAYRSSKESPDYPDIAPIAKALIAANPQRILWGSDWPHPFGGNTGRKPTDILPGAPIDDGRMLNQLAVWAPDAGLRKTILVDNPAKLYGF